MTTFNTGNPIGSTDARDRSDNSENLDLAVNSLSQTFVDRFGVTRDTLEGIYQKSAYYRVGTFDAGYTLTNNRQTLAYGNVEYSWSGAFPKVVPAGSTPTTAGGVGAGAWVDRTDLMLRSEIFSDDLTLDDLHKLPGLLEKSSFNFTEDLASALSSSEQFIFYTGPAVSVTVPKNKIAYIVNVNSVGIDYSFSGPSKIIEIKNNGTVITKEYDNSADLVDSHGSVTQSVLTSTAKNDFLDYGTLLIDTKMSFDSVELKSGRYQITSQCNGTFPSAEYTLGVLIHHEIDNTTGSQLFIANYGAIFQRRWRIIGGQPSYGLWRNIAHGALVQADSYPQATANLNDYTAWGNYRLNITTAANGPYGLSNIVGALEVTGNNDASHVIQTLTVYTSAQHVVYKRVYANSAWGAWNGISTGLLTVKVGVTDTSLDLNAFIHAGSYRVNSGGVAAANGPVSVVAGVLEILSDEIAGYIVQKYFHFSTPRRLFDRWSNNGGSTWSAWVETT